MCRPYPTDHPFGSEEASGEPDDRAEKWGVRYVICGTIYYLRKAHSDSSASEEVLNIALKTSTRVLGASCARGKTLQPTTRGLKGSLAALPIDRR